jgi:hypothetical protein
MSDCPKKQQQNKTNFADTHFAQILFQESVGTPTNSVDLMGKRENLELVDEYEQTRKRLRKLESKLRKQKKKEQSSHREHRGRSRTPRQPGAYVASTASSSSRRPSASIVQAPPPKADE